MFREVLWILDQIHPVWLFADDILKWVFMLNDEVACILHQGLLLYQKTNRNSYLEKMDGPARASSNMDRFERCFPYLSFRRLLWAANRIPLLLLRMSVQDVKVKDPVSIIQKRQAGELYGSIWWSVPTVSLPSPLSDGPGQRCVASSPPNHPNGTAFYFFFIYFFCVFGFSRIFFGFGLKWTLFEYFIQ